MNVAMLIPDGVGVRNFVLGRFLPHVSQRGAACVLHVIPEHLRERYDPA
jgi:hypothetical protein